ncbi:MAG: PAS domain-containing protein [Roseomonas sp.]|nr:PAS domain-containing protein [Roseomonas sp.]MBX9698644.1 PAS domain-containing protein [Acetobacteraceae bacterium]
MLLVVVLPTILFASFVVFRFAEHERDSMVDAASALVREAVAALDADMLEILATARVLAGSEALERGDLEDFHRRAARAATLLGASVIALRNSESRQVMNSSVPWGASLPTTTNLAETDREVARTGQPAVSNVFRGITVPTHSYAVVVPVATEGAPHFLSLSFPVARIQRILDGYVTPPPGTIAGIVDRDGVFAARTRHAERLVGSRSPNQAAGLPERAGKVWLTSPENVRALLVYRWSEVADWRVGTTLPEAVLHAPLRRSLILMGVIAAGALALGLGAALLVGRELTVAVATLGRAGDALRKGVAPPPVETPVREVNAAGAALHAALAEAQRAEAARAQAAAELHQADERFRVALLGTPFIMYTCDRELRYTWIINQHRDVQAGDIIGRRDDDLGQTGTAEEKAALMALKQRVVESGEGERADLAWTGSDGQVGYYDVIAEPLRDLQGEVIGATVAALDVTTRVRDAETLRRQQDQLRLLINELNHRVKNTLASVQSIAGQTLRGARDVDAARRALQERLLALARAHDILTRTSWEGAWLSEVLDTALAAHCPREPGRLRVSGPPVWLPPKVALAIALAAHELATNAAKYGSLSSPRGRLDLTWRVDTDHMLTLRWVESDGPPVNPPARRGFGSRLLERGLSHDLGGEARLDFLPSGVVCTISARLPQQAEGVGAPITIAASTEIVALE